MIYPKPCFNQNALFRLAPLLPSLRLALDLDPGLVLRFTFSRGDPRHNVGERVLDDPDAGDFGWTRWIGIQYLFEIWGQRNALEWSFLLVDFQFVELEDI